MTAAYHLPSALRRHFRSHVSNVQFDTAETAAEGQADVPTPFDGPVDGTINERAVARRSRRGP
jgi:hypothetical protein